MVRRGCKPNFLINATACKLAMIPDPSSCAPRPTSQESMWPPEHDHFFGMLASRNFAHHIAAIGIGILMRVHFEMDPKRNFLRREAAQHQRIFDTQRRRRNFRLRLIVIESSRVRDLHRQRSDRAQQHCDRAHRRPQSTDPLYDTAPSLRS